MDHAKMRHLHGGKPGVSRDIVFKERHEIADGTWLVVFEKPETFQYRAGQHVRMHLKGHHRFWSFASSPFQPDLAFAIRLRDTPAKRALMRLPVGAKVRIDMMPDPPPGAFVLDDTEMRTIVFLCGGIGVVPAVSMIRRTLRQGSGGRFVLLYACQRPSAAPFLDELTTLAAEHGNFTFVPSMTRLDDNAVWSGERGRIDRAMMDRHVPGLADADVYVAGLRSMVQDMRELLRDAGIPATAIRTEDFGDFAFRRRSRILPPILTVVAVLLAVALHAVPVALWLRTGTSRPAMIAAGLVAVVVAIKCLWLLRRPRHTAKA